MRHRSPFVEERESENFNYFTLHIILLMFEEFSAFTNPADVVNTRRFVDLFSTVKIYREINILLMSIITVINSTFEDQVSID